MNSRTAKSAIFSPGRDRRYWLERTLEEPDWLDGTVNFIGLNPSEADETNNDMTIRKVLGFAKRWGYRRIIMTNLIPIVSKDPWALPAWNGFDEHNWEHVARALQEAQLAVIAWGDVHRALRRAICLGEYIHRLRWISSDPFYCIGTTRRGAPLHPSRTAYTAAPCKYEFEETISK